MQTPPHDLAAEQSVLGAVMLNNAMIPEVLELIKAGDFYRPVNAMVFDAVVALFTRGEPADAITVGQELTVRKQFSKVGGAPALLDMIAAVPMASNAVHYAKVVAQKSKLRGMIAVGNRLVALASEAGDDDFDTAIGQAEQYFREIRKPSESGVMFGELTGLWQAWQQRPEDIIETPWPELNEYLGGGLRKGKLYVIAGRPGSGKSMGGLNMAAHIAENGLPVTVFSLEMGKLEVAGRLLASGAYANYGQIFRKKMERETFERVNEYIDTRRGMNLEVVDKAGVTVEQIIAHIRARKPACVFIDYCQLITASFRGDRREAIDHITRSLKVCASDTGTAIILASQVNRNGDGRMPTIADLRESGSIENDADVVLLLHREDESAGTVKMNVGKNRDGKQGTIEFIWRGDLARIG